MGFFGHNLRQSFTRGIGGMPTMCLQMGMQQPQRLTPRGNRYLGVGRFGTGMPPNKLVAILILNNSG